MTDPISDMIIRIKNGGEAHKESVLIPYSKLKAEIASVLEQEGFIKSAVKKGKKVAKFLEVGILYDEDTPRIQDVKRISKSSRRIYKKASELHKVKNGFGISVVSTPKGILTGASARKQSVGGEVLFEIW